MSNCSNSARASGIAAALTLGLLALPATPARADDVSLVETGSTLLYPLFGVWADDYAKTHPGVKITTAATGSGARSGCRSDGCSRITPCKGACRSSIPMPTR